MEYGPVGRLEKFKFSYPPNQGPPTSCGMEGKKPAENDQCSTLILRDAPGGRETNTVSDHCTESACNPDRGIRHNAHGKDVFCTLGPEDKSSLSNLLFAVSSPRWQWLCLYNSEIRQMD